MKLSEGVTAPLLYVYCDDRSHTGRVAKICRFRDLKNAEGVRISIDMDVWRADGKGVDNVDIPARTVVLRSDNDTVVTSDYDGLMRAKREVECPLCKLSAKAREETVMKKVGQLFDHGVSSISLRGLAATFRL
jgi:hypothetical protein